jgi:hypothetical protein
VDREDRERDCEMRERGRRKETESVDVCLLSVRMWSQYSLHARRSAAGQREREREREREEHSFFINFVSTLF